MERRLSALKPFSTPRELLKNVRLSMKMFTTYGLTTLLVNQSLRTSILKSRTVSRGSNTWFKTDSENFVPPTWSDVLALYHVLNRIWIQV